MARAPRPYAQPAFHVFDQDGYESARCVSVQQAVKAVIELGDGATIKHMRIGLRVWTEGAQTIGDRSGVRAADDPHGAACFITYNVSHFLSVAPDVRRGAR